MTYDVVVVGGGAAGLAAAVAAGSAGARTALVERYGFLGGMATAGMVSTICGLYHDSPSGSPEPLNEGFAETFARRLAAMPGCQKPVRRGRTFVLPYTPFAFACVADELVGRRRRSTSTFTRTSGRRRHARQDRGAAYHHLGADRRAPRGGRGRHQRDGVVARQAGAATETSAVSDRQLPALVFVLHRWTRTRWAPVPGSPAPNRGRRRT